MRVAAFRYLLPFLGGRLDPTDVAGVSIFRNTEEGAVIDEGDLVWEHEWETGLVSTNLFWLSKELDRAVVAGGQTVRRRSDGRRRGVDVELNQLVTDAVGLVARWRYLEVRDDSFPTLDRDEHRVDLALRYSGPHGLTAGVRQIVRPVDRKRGLSDDVIWSTDVDVAWEFPGKRGEFTLGVHNLFDQEYNWVVDRFTIDGQVPDREIFTAVRVNF